VFASKIWFFLISIVAFTAITLALAMPLPAERATVASETVRLKRACGVANVLLSQNARDRIDLASAFARADAPAGQPRLKLDAILFAASKASSIDADAHGTAKKALSELVDSVKGNKPDFVIATDRHGRVVARNGLDDKTYGDSLAGYYAVDDALDGYLRDDVWFLGGRLYRVAISPVIERRAGVYAGTVVLGHEFDGALAKRVTDNIGAHIAFYANGSVSAASHTAQVHKDVVAAYQAFADKQPDIHDGTALEDCSASEPFTVSAGNEVFNVVFARLPGEAREQGAFYATFSEKPEGLGFFGTLKQVTSNDLGFGSFPWLRIAVLFLVAVGLGLAAMVWEVDLPLGRLVNDALVMSKGETARLDEGAHRGKYGRVARSVNIVLDKLEREAKSAKRDLDSLLGPAPEGGVSVGAGPAALPSAGPGGPAAAPVAPPPPAEFKFNDGKRPAAPAAAAAKVRPPSVEPVVRAGAFDLDLPPPPPAFAPAPPVQPGPPRPISLPDMAPVQIDDDILGITPHVGGAGGFDAPTRVADPSPALLTQSAQNGSGGEDESEFRKVFDDFTALKEQCGETIEALTFEKFAGKLRKNRAALIAKHGCKSVKFQVYVKDGKAALKATPVKL
jgi:hypothetical protein